ncbi:alpha/beta hydrolase [Bordetella flabilis]|uniref:alpha/beta hydrolase n=1 Tax=Bordetella flabilis TaxID=463014 RepID=UPI000A06BD1D|nr:alpha/beta hydrolase [Bordetella flabilis]
MKSLTISALGVTATLALTGPAVQAHEVRHDFDTGTARIVAMREHSLVGTRGFLDRRSAFESLMAQFAVPAGVTIRAIDANGVPAKWISPEESASPASPGSRPHGVILYLHGGGFYSGSSDSHRVLGATLAKDANADLLLVDYRRMPEAVYPAQIDDAVSSYEWLLAQGYSASQIAIAGESAGGNLVLELALRLRAAGRPLPSSMVAMSPIMDLTASGGSTRANAKRDPVLQRDGLLEVTRVYMHGADPRSPDASPLFADLRGLPPLMLQVGAGELLLDDSLRMAEHAARDDVAVTVEVWPGMVHQWQLFPAIVPDARRALRHCAAFIRTHMVKPGRGQTG